MKEGGSPPHTRGILKIIGGSHGDCGITPAHAGNTSDFRFALRTCQDHPRTRGEYQYVTTQNLNDMGSPPHTRGILQEARLF